MGSIGSAILDIIKGLVNGLPEKARFPTVALLILALIAAIILPVISGSDVTPGWILIILIFVVAILIVYIVSPMAIGKEAPIPVVSSSGEGGGVPQVDLNSPGIRARIQNTMERTLTPEQQLSLKVTMRLTGLPNAEFIARVLDDEQQLSEFLGVAAELYPKFHNNLVAILFQEEKV